MCHLQADTPFSGCNLGQSFFFFCGKLGLTKTQLSEQHVATYPALGHKSEHKCWH
jgi:hypothetical protein